MKVRDLRQYIKSISKGNETLELVGSNKEYFLNMMSGQGQKVDSLITGAGKEGKRKRGTSEEAKG